MVDSTTALTAYPKEDLLTSLDESTTVHETTTNRNYSPFTGKKRRRGRPPKSEIGQGMNGQRVLQTHEDLSKNLIQIPQASTFQPALTKGQMLNQAKLLKQELKKIKKRDLKQRVKVALQYKKLKKRGRKPKSESLKQDQALKMSADAFINKSTAPAYSAYSNSVSQLDCYQNFLKQNVDISTWENKANIVVPPLKRTYLLEEPRQDPKEPAAFALEGEVVEIESDGDELTDDEVFLERHDRALVVM